MRIGFIVMEGCEEWEQGLALDRSKGMPEGGVLHWREPSDPVHVFGTRAEARAAINRTDHYRQAFSTTHPYTSRWVDGTLDVAFPALTVWTLTR